MPVIFSIFADRRPVSVIASGIYMYYTLDLKTWYRSRLTTSLTAIGAAYDPSNDLYAVSIQTTSPGSVIETTGQGFLSNFNSRNSGAWRSIGARSRNASALMRYANDNWFICDTSFISKIPVKSTAGTFSTVSSIVFTDVAYSSPTGRYLFSGSGTVRHTTDLSTFTSVAVGFGSSPVTTLLAVGSGGRIVVGGEALGGVGRISTTDNGGTSWTNRTIAGTRVRSLSYLSQLGLYVVANQSGEIYTSSDAVTWTIRATMSAGVSVYTLGYSNKMKVAYAIDQRLNTYVSSDGLTWSDNGARISGFELSTFLATRGAAVS